MAQAKKTETVPKAMQEKFDRITAITDEFAREHLNDEYAQMIRYATAALCRKRPSPLASGQPKSWACGITHAIGMVNFLYDPAQTPHIPAKDLYAAFGVSVSTGQGKSKQIRDLLNMHQLDPDWTVPSMIEKNPMAWMISYNGLLIDARSAPRPIQEIAYAKGLIPYLPEEAPGSRTDSPASAPAKSAKATTSKKTSNKKNSTQTSASGENLDALYTLTAFIIDGPLTEAFVAQNPEMSRTIEIKGSHTLKDLHRILFRAFDREDEHLYEFQIGGKGPMDPEARRYGIPSGSSELDGELDGDVATTRIGELGLSQDEAFGYWFDFGDDWWHQVNVDAIAPKAPKGKYPKITNRVGASPPQYPDFD
jgi:hypothetical protein